MFECSSPCQYQIPSCMTEVGDMWYFTVNDTINFEAAYNISVTTQGRLETVHLLKIF